MSSSNWPGRLCEEFNRNTSTPALISLRIISGVEDVGPSVETTCKAAETASEVLATTLALRHQQHHLGLASQRVDFDGINHAWQVEGLHPHVLLGKVGDHPGL